MLEIKILGFLLVVIFSTAASSNDENKTYFRFTLLKWIRPSTLKVEWMVDPTSVNVTAGFSFFIIEDESESFLKVQYPTIARSAVINTHFRKYKNIVFRVNLINSKLGAKHEYSETLPDITVALCTEEEKLFACNDLYCHDKSILFKADSSILAICYGDTYDDAIFLTKSQIMRFNIESNKSNAIPLEINDKITAIDYDWLNKIVAITTQIKIFLVNIESNVVFEIDSDKEVVFLHAVMDPINGFIHILMESGLNYFLVHVPAVISKNTTISRSTAQETRVNMSYALLLGPDNSHLNLLSKNNIYTFYFANLTWTSCGILAKTDFDPTWKLQKYPNGFVVWKKNKFYQLDQDPVDGNVKLTDMDTYFDFYTNTPSINRSSPVPDLPFKITNVFFDKEAVRVNWIQPIAKRKFGTSWNKFVFTVRVIANGSSLHETFVRFSNYFEYDRLRRNSSYIVTIKIGHHSQSVTGRTLDTNADKTTKYFLIRNENIDVYEMGMRKFNIIRISSFLNNISSVKDVLMFNNRGFILLTNGTILEIFNHSTTVSVPQLSATTFDIDIETTNVYFINSINHWVYRYRTGRKGNYKIDLIIQSPVKSIAIFRYSMIMVYLNASGIFSTDFNGFEHRKLSIGITVIDCNSRPLRMVEINNERHMLNLPDEKRCEATTIGMTLITDKDVSLKNWHGNSSVTLLSSSANIDGVRLLDNVNARLFVVEPVQVETITINRSQSNEVLLKWQPLNSPSEISYLLTIENVKRKKIWKLFINDTRVNIRQYAICTDVLDIDIKSFTQSTYADSVKIRLSVPCTTDRPAVTDLFINKKVHTSPTKAVLEIRASLITGVSEIKIDGEIECSLNVIFTKKSVDNYNFYNKSVLCGDKYQLLSLEMDKNYQFQWTDICVRVNIGDAAAMKCLSTDFLNTNEKEIIFSYNQSLISSCAAEYIYKLFISSNGQSIYVTNSWGPYRKILQSRATITKIEMDWPRDVLIWSEETNDNFRIFSVGMKSNKRNLYEDRTLWIEESKIQQMWTTNSITRMLIVHRKDKILNYNLDEGPGWSHNHDALSECNKLLQLNDTIKCTDQNMTSTMSVVFVTNKKLIVLENFQRTLCKIIRISDNYYVPDYISSCSAMYARPYREYKSMKIYLNGTKKNVYTNGDGYVFIDKDISPLETSLHLFDFHASITVQCNRYSASLQIIPGIYDSRYRFQIIYTNDSNNTLMQASILTNKMVDKKCLSLTIVNLQSGMLYQFMVTIHDTSTNESNTVSCMCTTQDDAPDSPKNLTLRVMNATHYIINWLPSSQSGGQPLDYMIKLFQSDGATKSYGTKETKFVVIRNYWKDAKISIVARNNIGTSSEIYIDLTAPETKKQNISSSYHASMAFSTAFFLIIVLILAAIILIILIYAHQCRVRKRNSTKLKATIVNIEQFEMEKACQNIKYDVNCLYSIEKLPLSNFDKIPHILNECVTYSHLIGNGAFGMVFKGVMKVESDNGKILQESVALKIRNAKAISEEDFKREAVLLFKYCHPNIIQLHGVSFDCPDKQCLILEYMEKGNLRQYLQHHRPEVIKRRMQKNPKRKIINENSILDIKDLINMSADILEALKFLEEKRFVHRDIAARNCLVSQQHKKRRIIKLGDFGLARDIYSDEYYRKVSETKLPVRWMAPETIKDGIFTGKSDVWAFGVLCWEIITFGADPYMGQANSEVIKDVIAGKHLDRPDNCPTEFYEIMVQCWKYYPECRPSFSEIDLLYQYLEEIKDVEEVSTLSRLIIRSYNSSHDSEFGRNSDPNTEKTFVTISDKYTDVSMKPSVFERVVIQPNYDNLGYEIPATPLLLSAQESQSDDIS